jgi:hypothetical protein
VRNPAKRKEREKGVQYPAHQSAHASLAETGAVAVDSGSHQTFSSEYTLEEADFANRVARSAAKAIRK